MLHKMRIPSLIRELVVVHHVTRMTGQRHKSVTDIDRSTRTPRSALPITQTIEWPTLAVAAAVYVAFALLTWFHEALPGWLLLLCGGFVTCLHGSLQHEVVHGHPTRWRWLNEALVFPSLWLWMPYRTYERTHLDHHSDPTLTHPLEDPESYYVTPETWSRIGPMLRGFLWAQNTVAGRLLLGPLRSLVLLVISEGRALLRREPGHAVAWLLHIPSVAIVVLWAVWLCGMDFWLYVLTFAYPGLSLTLLRSFLEHQARPDQKNRTVLVEAGPVMSLLFLNNNLHALHHSEPGMAWYRLPARYRARRAQLLEENGDYRYRNYLEILARYAFWPKEPPIHPFVETAVLFTTSDQEPQLPFNGIASAEPKLV